VRRLTVVSAYAHNPLTPRGQRTQRVVESLSRGWDVDLIALPPSAVSRNGSPARGRSVARRVASRALHSVMLDRWEPWSIRRFRGWRPEADGALLVAYPWSPVAAAARRLRAAGIPYVVDAGDPWVLTGPEFAGPRLTSARARPVERALWGGAAGAVVTTKPQHDRLRRLFPDLPMLVRPNGYDPVPAGDGVGTGAARRDPSQLRLVHFGMLAGIRLEIGPLLETLLRSGRWQSIVFAQFGDDYAGMLTRVPDRIEVERHAARPWPEAMAAAAAYDVAVVVGNQRGLMLPSKAIQYLTLPMPRLAVAESPDDALGAYVHDRPAWLTLTPEEPDAARLLWEHVNRDWSAAELSPPEEEAWPAVARQVGEFIESCVER
jgi:hypothetical protein